MGKSTISMAIFNSYVKLPEGSWKGGSQPTCPWKAQGPRTENRQIRLKTFRPSEPIQLERVFFLIYLEIQYLYGQNMEMMMVWKTQNDFNHH